MPQRSWPLLLLTLVQPLLVAAVAFGQATPEQTLALGIRQVGDGDFETAVFTLDSAVRKLLGQPGRARELARAYLHLGVAYVGLDHEDAAKGKFREALTLDPELQLASDEFSPRVIRVFETQRMRLTARKKSRGAKMALLLGGVGAAGAVTVAATKSKPSAPANRAPSVSIGQSPDGQALAAVTNLRFTASASDPDGDPLSYTWNFGDGGTATGESVTHRFETEGTFSVTVTATDSRGAAGGSQRSVTSRSMNGTWQNTGFGGAGTQLYRCAQAGPTYICDPIDTCATSPAACWILRWSGTLRDPRLIFANLTLSNRTDPCEGDLANDLNTVRCLDPSGTAYQISRR